jgi:hypothetical protein
MAPLPPWPLFRFEPKIGPGFLTASCFKPPCQKRYQISFSIFDAYLKTIVDVA